MLIRNILNNCHKYGAKPAIIDGHSGESLTYHEIGLHIEASVSNFIKQGISTVASVGEPNLIDLISCLSIGLIEGTWIPLFDENQVALLNPTTGAGNRILVLNSRASKHQILNPNGSKSEGTKPFLVTFSSGTTGSPKGVMIDQFTKLARTEQAIRLFGTTHEDIILSSSPVHHSLGQRHLFMSLLVGATLIRNVPFSVSGWLSCAHSYQPTFAIPVSTQIKLLEDQLSASPNSLTSFKTLVMSSAPCSLALKQFLFDRNIDLWETYGCTETAFATATKISNLNQLDHVGDPVEGVDIIVDPDTEEIKVKTPFLCQGYLGQESLFRKSLDGNGFFNTGDRGAWLNSYLQFKGRLGLEFNVAGKKVNPLAIEKKISSLGNIRSAVVVPVDNPIFDNTVGIFFEIDNSEELDESILQRQILEWAAANLEKHEVPSHLIPIKNLPLLPTGKINRQQLIHKMKKIRA